MALTINVLMIVVVSEPGGYLQWAEPDIASFRIDKIDPTCETNALSDLMKISQSQDARLKPTWVPRLPALFTDCKLESVESDVRDAPPHLALAMHECNLPIHELIARKTGNAAVAKALSDLMPEIERETRLGSCWAFTRWVVIGKKPAEGN